MLNKNNTQHPQYQNPKYIPAYIVFFYSVMSPLCTQTYRHDLYTYIKAVELYEGKNEKKALVSHSVSLNNQH